jgi:hypothetical protein
LATADTRYSSGLDVHLKYTLGLLLPFGMFYPTVVAAVCDIFDNLDGPKTFKH